MTERFQGWWRGESVCFSVTISRSDYWLPVCAQRFINMLSGAVTPALISVPPHHSHTFQTVHPTSLHFSLSLSHNRWGEKESHREKISILRWLAFTVSLFKWYFHSEGTTFPPVRIIFWKVYLFEIGDDTNIFIPFHVFASRRAGVGAGAINFWKNTHTLLDSTPTLILLLNVMTSAETLLGPERMNVSKAFHFLITQRVSDKDLLSNGHFQV